MLWKTMPNVLKIINLKSNHATRPKERKKGESTASVTTLDT